MRDAAFLGSKQFGYKVLVKLLELAPETNWHVFTLEDPQDEHSAFEQFCDLANKFPERLRISIVSTKPNLDECFKGTNISVVFVCGWYSIIKTSTLNSVPLGFWGIHHSLLPKYRGFSPLVWSIVNDDKYVGSTFFKITKNIDAGPIAFQIKIRNSKQLNINDIRQILEDKILVKMEKIVPRIFLGNLETVKQKDHLATYSTYRTSSDNLINWDLPAENIHNFIRANFRKSGGAYTYLGRKKIEISASKILPSKYFGTPGRIIRVGTSFLAVVCGNHSAIVIDSVYLNDEELSVENRDELVHKTFKNYPANIE